MRQTTKTKYNLQTTTKNLRDYTLLLRVINSINLVIMIKTSQNDLNNKTKLYFSSFKSGRRLDDGMPIHLLQEDAPWVLITPFPML